MDRICELLSINVILCTYFRVLSIKRLEYLYPLYNYMLATLNEEVQSRLKEATYAFFLDIKKHMPLCGMVVVAGTLGHEA